MPPPKIFVTCEIVDANIQLYDTIEQGPPRHMRHMRPGQQLGMAP
jgi:hypothetical protein